MVLMEGIVTKGVGGVYTVFTSCGQTVDAVARGRLKNEGIKPVIGDRVCLEKEASSFAVVKVLERKNCLIRPAVANIDSIVVVIAAAQPNPSFKQTDKLLVMLEHKEFDITVCINKTDLDKGEAFGAVYEKAGYRVLYVNTKDGVGLEDLKLVMKDKITAFAGCSGVGKSSLINAIDPSFSLKTGAVGKMKRGKHTTTHAQLLPLSFGGYIADTPGFSVVDISNIDKESLYLCYPEMEAVAGECKFVGCSHTNEPGCRVIERVKLGDISQERYESYVALYKELCAVYKY